MIRKETPGGVRESQRAERTGEVSWQAQATPVIGVADERTPGLMKRCGHESRNRVVYEELHLLSKNKEGQVHEALH